MALLKALATKQDNLSSLHRSHKMEGKCINSHKLSSESYTKCCTCVQTDRNTHNKYNVKKTVKRRSRLKCLTSL